MAPPVAVPTIVVPPPASMAPRVEEPRAVPTRRVPSPPPPAAAPVDQDEPAPAITTTPPSPAPSPVAPQPIPATVEDGNPWPWVLGALLLLAALGLAAWAWKRGRARPRAAAALEIERPHVAPRASPQTPAPAPSPSPGEPLHVTLEPLRLSLTLMNAALAWRLEVANRGDRPLIGLTVGADMISAHASLTREEQLSGPGDQQGTQRIERLEPGESRRVEGEFRLPLGQIVPIRQGNMTLLLPLARFRLEAEGARPLVRTFAVGQPGNGSALQPFRLDQGPRIYPQLAQRAFT